MKHSFHHGVTENTEGESLCPPCLRGEIATASQNSIPLVVVRTRQSHVLAVI
jgi:hypothetical protein